MVTRRPPTLVLILAMALLLLAARPRQASGQSAPTRLIVAPGGEVLVASAACIEVVQAPASGTLEISRSGSRVFATFRSPADQTADVTFAVKAGDKPGTDKCEAATLRNLSVGVDRTPRIPDDVTNVSFKILIQALVLALLLESAFALLFNWRVFLEFFAGRAWRTPVMFAGALMVVRTFDLDLMASLFDAYRVKPVGAASAGSWFTSVLTAMVLAGGSAGVNRILVGLGFRTQVRPEAIEPQLEETEAFIAVRVASKAGGDHYQVNVTEEPNAVPLGTTIGFVRARGVGQRLRDVLFQSWTRVPRSGGRRIRVDRAYSITVVDMKDGKVYDALGEVVTPAHPPRVFRFGPRAIVDFEVSVP